MLLYASTLGWVELQAFWDFHIATLCQVLLVQLVLAFRNRIIIQKFIDQIPNPDSAIYIADTRFQIRIPQFILRIPDC